MIDKEQYRDGSGLIQWSKYAEALRRQNQNMNLAIDTLEEENEKLKKALKECCIHSSCRYITIEDEYCEHEDVVDTCEDCLFNHFMKGVQDE